MQGPAPSVRGVGGIGVLLLFAGAGVDRSPRRGARGRGLGDLLGGEGVAGVGVVDRRREDDAEDAALGGEQRAAGVAGPHLAEEGVHVADDGALVAEVGAADVAAVADPGRTYVQPTAAGV